MNLPLSTDVTGNLSVPPAPPDTQPNVENLVTEDDTPLDGIYSEKQMRLLTEPLYQSWAKLIHPRTFVATANVGMFYSVDEPPLVPDVLLSLDVRVANELAQKVNRSYFFWKFGKSPEVVIEVVSNLEGEELGEKKAIYARIGIRYYVVWDPFHFLGADQLHCFLLSEKVYKKNGTWFPAVGLGIKEWSGTFEGKKETWLRWCDQQGQLIPTGGEAAERGHQRAAQERQRAERLADQLRAHGIEPDAS